MDPSTSPDKEPELSVSEYEKDGGHQWMPVAEQYDLFHSVKNGPLWEKAKERSQKEYGHIKWPFVMWLYKKLGG